MEVIDNYAIGPVIGKGSYAVVKEGLDVTSKQIVAIKVVAQATLKNIENGELLVKREVSILSSLRHSNVLRMIDDFIVMEKEKMYIILEFVDGGNLQQLLDRAPGKKLSLYQAQKIYKGIIKGLLYLQKEKIVHRDIKPENILLMQDGTVKIGDFGCAVRINSEIEIETSLYGPGSPAFQPPEQESKGLTMKLDVWSSGVVLFMMTVGEFPFAKEGEQGNLMELFENISKAKYTLPKNFDENLRDLIRHVLEINPDARLSLKQIEKHAWMEKHIKHSKTDEIPIVAVITTKFTPENIELLSNYTAEASVESVHPKITKKDSCLIM
jgi:serine/threonine-protein kinase 11